MYDSHLLLSRCCRIRLHRWCRRVDLPLPHTSHMAGRSRLCEAMGGRMRSVITHRLAAIVDSVQRGLVKQTMHLVGALLVLTLQFVDDFLYQ
ncbi:hypothetical protein D3C76_1524010 [compost metagenome]